jgi:hypothetical protein
MSAIPVPAVDMTTTALFSYYGANRILARHVGRELHGRPFVLIPFAGGFSEVPHIGARSLLVADRHVHLTNCARVAADPVLGPQMYRRLRRLPFSMDVLEAAQARCRLRDAAQKGGLFDAAAAVDSFAALEWAIDYYVASWMGRGGRAGTKGEFAGGISYRMDAGGGDSATRFRSAVLSLPAWRRTLSRCTILTTDGFDLLEKCGDRDDAGVYCDPPFPAGGDPYKHTFNPADHERLARVLHRFERARVVLRYYDHPIVRALYPRGRWTWVERIGRKATNGSAPEVLLINGPSQEVA